MAWGGGGPPKNLPAPLQNRLRGSRQDFLSSLLLQVEDVVELAKLAPGAVHLQDVLGASAVEEELPDFGDVPPSPASPPAVAAPAAAPAVPTSAWWTPQHYERTGPAT